MAVMYCHLERRNDRVLKFHVKIFSYFEIIASIFSTPPSNKRRNDKLKGQAVKEKLIQDYISNPVLVHHHSMTF